jgi:hypothetical protein
MFDKKAFLDGFWDGLCAPGLLFSPPPDIEIRKPEPVPLSPHPFEDDWMKISGDFQRAIQRYEAST